MTSIELQHPPDDRAAGLDLRPDLGLEAIDSGLRLEPCVGHEARLQARLGEELIRAPPPIDRDLGQKEATLPPARGNQPIGPDSNLVDKVLGLANGDEFWRCQDADLDDDAV